MVLPSVAFAGGYTLPVHGVRSTGKGGAAIATAEGADALWVNPANLDETQLHLEAAMIDLQARYTKSDGDDRGTVAVNNPDALPNPSAVFVFKATDHLSLALGAYAPWSGTVNFAENGPQRYALVRNDESKVVFLHAAASIRLGDLRIGGGVQNVVARLRQRLVASGYTGVFGWAEDPELDVLTNIDLDDPFTITANAGATYSKGPFTFAASLQLPFSLSGNAKLENRLPSSLFFDPVRMNGTEAYIEIPFPLTARAGVAWQATDWLNVEMAGTFEDWSVQQQIEITPLESSLDDVPLIGHWELGSLILDKRMKDTFSLHLGGEAYVGKGVSVTSGVFYEPSAFSDATFSAALPDDEKLGIGLGASWRIGAFRLDAAVSRIFQGTRTVTESQLTQVNPTNPSQAAVIGNGVYETGYWVGGLSFAWFPGGSETAGLGRPEDTLDISSKK